MPKVKYHGGMSGAGKEWCARTGMHELLFADQDSLRRSGIRIRNGVLEVILRPGTSARTLEEAVRHGPGGRQRGYWLARGTGLGAGLAIGGAMLLVLALLDMFNQLLGTAILDREVSTAWHRVLLLATFLLGGAAVSFAPRLLSGDGGWARTLVMRWVDGETRALARINRQLRIAVKRGVLQRVVVWNAFEPASIGNSGILACFRDVPLAIELRIHHDEQDGAAEFWALLRSESPAARIVEHSGPAAAGTIGDDPWRMLQEITGNAAALAFGTAVQHSSLGATGPWLAAIKSSGAFSSAGIAYRLAAARFDAANTATQGAADIVSGSTWMLRFVHDYGLFTPEITAGVLRTTAGFPPGNPLRHQRDAAAALEMRHPAQAPLPEHLKADVAAVFVTLLRTEERDWNSAEFTSLLNHYVRLAAAQEHYRGVQVLAELITTEFERPSDERRLLPLLDINSLTALQEPLSVGGHGHLAIHLARWIASFTGRRGVLQRARLLERIGSYDAAHQELQLLDSAAEADEELTDALLRVRAWVLLSAGRDDPGWGPEVARDHLERLELRHRRTDRTRTPEQARELENYWALLHEWEGNRAAAIECHQRAIELPGVPLRRVLGSTINKGRALRDLALQPLLEQCTAGVPVASADGPWNAALDTLAEAGAIITRGYHGKLEIGDTDEAPIGAHNLALVQLYQSAIAARLGQESAAFARAAQATALAGLAVLTSTGSTRKKSTLLAETRLAARLAGDATAMEPEPAELLPKADRMNLDWVLILAGIPLNNELR